MGIPVKDSEETISPCLRSIVESEFGSSKMEIILVDGGSEDNTLGIAEEILTNSDFNFNILRDKGRGVAYARHMIAERADGDYIAWIDSDNTVEDDFFTESLRQLESGSEIVGTYPSVVPKESGSFAGKLQALYLESQLLKNSENRFLPGSTQGFVCKTRAIRKVGGFDTRFISGEDKDLFIRMKKRGWEFSKAHTRVYHLTRKSWKEIFNQAVWWEYGRFLLHKKHPKFYSSMGEKSLYFQSRVLNVFREFCKITKKAVEGFRRWESVFVPLYFVFRRSGYLFGRYLSEKNFSKDEAYE